MVSVIPPKGGWAGSVACGISQFATEPTRSPQLPPLLKIRIPNFARGLCGKPHLVWFNCLAFPFQAILALSLAFSRILLDFLQHEVSLEVHFISALGRRTLPLFPGSSRKVNIYQPITIVHKRLSLGRASKQGRKHPSACSFISCWPGIQVLSVRVAKCLLGCQTVLK